MNGWRLSGASRGVQQGDTLKRLRNRLKQALERRGCGWLRTIMRALSVLLSRGAGTPDEELIQALDQKGRRWLLGVLMNRSHHIESLGITRVFYRDGAWIHQYDNDYVLADPLGARLPTPDSLSEQTHETWERAYTPREGDVVVDIGAGVGTEVFRWSRRVGSAGKVLAVEAHPGTFGRLRLLCTLNKLTNVQLLNLAISETAGNVAIEDLSEHQAASIMSGRGTIAVQSITLDQMLDEARIDRVDYLKMNIEGAETAALRGMGPSARRIKRMCISCHDFRADMGHGEYFRTRDEVVRLLGDCGFEVELRTPNDPRPWIRDQVSAYRGDLTADEGS